MTDGTKDIMSGNRLAAVNEEVARLNARSVIQRMEKMQEQLDGYKLDLAQTNARYATLEGKFNAQSMLIAQLLNSGSRPTVR